MAKGLDQQDLAVKSGIWPLYRFNPDRADEGKNPLQLDSKAPSIPLKDYAYNELRYRSLLKSNEERAEKLMKLAQKEVDERWNLWLKEKYQTVENLRQAWKNYKVKAIGFEVRFPLIVKGHVHL